MMGWCMVGFFYELKVIDGQVWIGVIYIMWGDIWMLVFMFVGIVVIVKVMMLESVVVIGVDILLGNIYYLMLCLMVEWID